VKWGKEGVRIQARRLSEDEGQKSHRKKKHVASKNHPKKTPKFFLEGEVCGGSAGFLKKAVRTTHGGNTFWLGLIIFGRKS